MIDIVMQLISKNKIGESLLKVGIWVKLGSTIIFKTVQYFLLSFQPCIVLIYINKNLLDYRNHIDQSFSKFR